MDDESTVDWESQGLRYKPDIGLKAVIPAPGWWAIFDPDPKSAAEPTEQPLVCWALIIRKGARGGNLVGMYAWQDGVFLCDPVDTFARYEYRGESP